MNNSGTALVCNNQGNIEKIIRDNLNLFGSSDIGKSFMFIVDSANVDKVVNFHKAILNHYAVCNWEINVNNNKHIRTLNFSGIIFQEKLFLLIAELSQDILKFFNEIQQMHNLKVNKIREQNAMIRDFSHTTPDDQVYDELAKMNNELANLQRELSQRNYQLQQLKNNLEERVEQGVKELRDKDRLLMMQSKQAAMGEMISDIVHQWKQPLNALGLLIQDYEEAYEFEELNENYLQEQEKKGMQLIEYMSQTMNDFRNFLKPEKQKIEFNLKETVEKTINIFGKILEKKNIELKTDLQDIYIIGVENELIQVIINIINNAKDALLENKVESAQISIKTEQEGDKKKLRISDNAGGIPDDVLKNIFQAYFTTKKDKGTGIGLYMSKMIIEQTFSGKLKVQNLKKGACFTLVF
jgi:signal transduction histidine kinase